MIDSKLLYQCKDQTGETSTWFPALDSFLWVDIDNGILHQYQVKDKKVIDHYFPEVITSIVPWKGHDNEVILMKINRCVAYDIAKKTWYTLIDLKSLHPQFRTNDCKTSLEGRIWCGIMHMHTDYENASLYRVDNDGDNYEVLAGQCIPNGIVWNKEDNLTYYAYSGHSCIEEYAYNQKNDNITFRRVAVQVPTELSVSDGMTIDAQDNLWVVHWGGFGVYVWNPTDGNFLEKVSVPAPNVASCTFGGVDSKQLYITSAIDRLTEEEVQQYPLSGSLFVVNIDNVLVGQNHYPFINN